MLKRRVKTEDSPPLTESNVTETPHCVAEDYNISLD